MSLARCIYRDPEFYAENGDCVVLVGDALFKINSADFFGYSAVFRDLFYNRETSDEFLVLLEDAPEDFRDLCRIFQAQPTKLFRIFREASFLRLLSFIMILHKYECWLYADWAKQAIYNRFPLEHRDILASLVAFLLSIVSPIFTRVSDAHLIHNTGGYREQEDDPMTGV
ncbi:hypothetical protein DFH07DRAFT_768651 [Mycena maculata]|uniref:BTB domain-containing protein n=1 Tax=Mycena maculata TaxID=230809 RepID=A0AAD7JSB6_9AGAR|nr:hypothetical protein DFH07DRAFT_768651 [Mycena maculata]